MELIHQKIVILVHYPMVLEIDKRFIGKWKGSNNVSYGDIPTSSSWITEFKEDGTVSLDFVFVNLNTNDTTKYKETGNWYVKDFGFEKVYYEFQNSTQTLDSYHYEFKNNDEIYFKLKMSDSKIVPSDYEFTSYRLICF